MSLTVHLPDPMLEAVQAEAARRGVGVDTVIAESVQEHLATAAPADRQRFPSADIEHIDRDLFSVPSSFAPDPPTTRPPAQAEAEEPTGFYPALQHRQA